MLEEMVDIRLPEYQADVFRESSGKKDAIADMQGYLKIDKVGLTIGAEENVAAFVHVEINNVALVHLLE
ncbi:MAG: hypothetical protein ACYTBJ_03250 [Planctomycetota bacterium]